MNDDDQWSDSNLNLASDEADPHRRAVYDAEEVWWMETCDESEEDETHLEPEMVVPYMVAALQAGGWTTSERPVVLFDISTASGFSGAHRPTSSTIHLHPELCSPDHVLHELSHWIDDQDGHGPIHQANMVTLVHAAIGSEAAQHLLRTYRSFGLHPDEGLLP